MELYFLSPMIGERERETERGTEGQRGRERHRDRESEGRREREREREGGREILTTEENCFLFHPRERERGWRKGTQEGRERDDGTRGRESVGGRDGQGGVTRRDRE